jgi:SAM-dependent methyltransferase
MLSRFKEQLKKTPLGDLIYAQEFVLKRQLKNAGAQFPPRMPSKGWLNTTLQSKAQSQEAFDEAVACGLPPHPDVPKNWDALSTLKSILEHTSKAGAVLEVGAPLYSVMLQWLYLYGYRNLQGIDLVFHKKMRRGPIQYEYGDLTQTRFQNESYDSIISMSVIEHHVDLDKYFKEMSRLLKPQGRLFTSTDYWETPVDTLGEEAYGGPIHIFSRSDIEDMLQTAASFGLFPTSPPNFDCDEKAVCWERFQLNYTFTCFGLEKK